MQTWQQAKASGIRDIKIEDASAANGRPPCSCCLLPSSLLVHFLHLSALTMRAQSVEAMQEMPQNVAANRSTGNNRGRNRGEYGEEYRVKEEEEEALQEVSELELLLLRTAKSIADSSLLDGCIHCCTLPLLSSSLYPSLPVCSTLLLL